MFLILGSIDLYSQDLKTIDDNKICDEILTYNYIEPVDSFKEVLKLTIEINEFSLGRETKEYNIVWSENISNESPIIQVSKDGAMRVSIGRVIDNGKNYYIYRVHLYKKIKRCWEDRSTSVNWSRCKLGVITNGYGIGNKGTSNYIGFSGKIKIE